MNIGYFGSANVGGAFTVLRFLRPGLERYGHEVVCSYVIRKREASERLEADFEVIRES